MKPRVELIYDADCPNIEGARTAIVRAFVQVGLAPAWTEWDCGAPEGPAYAGAFGSPTILVEGRDVDGATAGETAGSCRLYDQTAGLEAVALVERITAALSLLTIAAPGNRGAQPSMRRGVWGVLPGIGSSLLPVGLCPACWPAYAGVLGSLGLSFLLDEHYLLALTVALLVVALFSLAWHAPSRRGYRPLLIGVLAAVLILAAKFAWPSPPLLYLGAAALLACSLWNSWPQRAAPAGSCAKCAPQSRSINSPSAGRRTQMNAKRQIEVFSAGCAVCEETIALVNRIACSSCEVSVLDVREPPVAARAKGLGITSVPAVVIDGKLADCCAGRGSEEGALRAAGLGRSLP